MGLNLIRCVLALLICANANASPFSEAHSFLRSAVETVPAHGPIAQPIRSSVESIPPRILREESEGRLPLRDAVEKRPIDSPDAETLNKLVEDIQDSVEEDVENLRHYYGAASHLNTGHRNDERLQQGNANLQAMQQAVLNPNGRKLVVCYLQSRAAYRSPPLAFTAGLVPRSCTHLHYASAGLHPHTYTIIPSNEDYDVVKGGYRITTGLKHRQPGLRVLISVGGDGTERLFSEMVEQPNNRRAFIDSAVELLKEFDFDGLEIHWTYAGDKSETDKDGLIAILNELKEAFSEYGFILSTVLPPNRYQIEDGYDIKALSGIVDYAILEGWDMTHRNRDEPPSSALQHSALHRDPGAAGRDQKYDNIEFMVKYIIRRGMAGEKLVLGVPLFGRSYTLAPSTLPAPGALVSDWGNEGQYTQIKGMLAYFEICMKEINGRGSSSMDEFGNAFAVFDNQWISYDSPVTIVEKMNFVVSTGLGGAAAWSIDMDDFRGLCGTPFPILSAIATSLNGESVQSGQSSLKLGPCDEDLPYLSSDEDSCAHFRFCSGSFNYRMVCEDDRLYDPSTGFCGHQDVTKCIPGQSLRISLDDAMRHLSHAYETDFEWNQTPMDETAMTIKEAERLVSSSNLQMKKRQENDKRVVCYMTSWAFYRRGDGKFVPEHIDSRLCTHVVYAYASLTPDELVAKEFDPWADITNNLYQRITSLNDVQVLLGLGGWTDSAGDKYSRLVSSASSRAKFIEKLIAFLKMHNFDGLHLDWNYPVCWQSNCKKGAISDKANFAKLAEELSKSLHVADMELGIAVSGYKEVIEAAYDLPALSKAADFLSTMTYDYHGGWERKTAHHTPLFAQQNDALAYYSIEYAIKALISGGADPKKLNLGLSLYGQSFRLADVEAPGTPGAPAAGPGEPGEFTKQPGMLGYYEICYRVKNLRWKTGRQANAGPYTYSDNQWVGYDDPKSITEKVEWALRQGIGGVTAWAIDLDDFNNRCCTEPFPLLRAAGRALGRQVPQPPTSLCERPPQPVTPAPPTTTTVASDGSGNAGAGGSHDHGQHATHGEHTSTTWPSWNPGSTTTSAPQTWWPQSTTSSTTTTTTKRPTTTTTTRTTRTTTRTTTTTSRPTAAPERPAESNLEGASCIAGEYRPAPADCGAYLQCESGQWRKQKCAPGLHWYASAGRCDWPAFAKCKETSNNAQSPTTTTLAPTTARPPTTTRRPYTTTTASTTTTTTTTQRPTTQKTTTTPKPSYVPSSGPSEGTECNGQDYQGVAGDCNSYLHCDGSIWRQQKCAPGLHWSTKQKNCDWPKYANCNSAPATIVAPKPTARPPPRPVYTTTTTNRPQTEKKKEGSACGGNDFHTAASTCDSYLLCVSGQWKKQQCPSGLNWDDAHKRCDWPEFAACKNDPQMNNKHSTTTTKRPMYVRPQATTTRPIATLSDEVTMKTRCITGTYHAHSKCNKFSVCVNGMLVTQSCAPGLVWNSPKSQCDFPNSASCSDIRENAASEGTMMQLNETPWCNSGEYAMFDGDCTRYRHCLFGKFEEFSCSAGLHWNQDKQICDWPKNAKCKKKNFSSAPNKPFVNPALGPSPKPQGPYEHVHEQELTTKPAVNKPLVPVNSNSKPALLNSPYKLVCYFTNWAWYRPGHGKYGPEDIDPSLCTHIVYGFAVLGSDSLMTAHDSWADYDNQFYEKVVEYKKYGIKVSIAIGGWNDSAGDKYSKLVNDPSSRARFVENAVLFLEKYGFDGLDLDWEYPKCWQVDCSMGPDSDKYGFAALVRELSAVMKPKGLLLSSAVSPSKKVIDAGYDVPTLARHLDWIAVMTYDYHGQWDKKTGHVAPLYYHPDDDNTYFNANYTMHYWLEKGAPKSKLIMGMPLYGQSFTIGTDWKTSPEMKARMNGTGLNVPVISGGDAGEYTRAKGFLAYYEICDRIRNKGWQIRKDPYGRMGPYAFKGNQWVSFDDSDIIKRKVAFIKSLKLAGGMVWALDLDDFTNRCGEGKHPLLNTIKKSFLDRNINSDYLPSQPMVKPPITDNDLNDIEVRPGYTKKPTTTRPMIETTKLPHIHTTRIPAETTSVTVQKEEPFKVVCYYTNWAWYRPESGKFTPSDIDPSLCTHIVYAFAVLDAEKLIIKPHDAWLDVENKFYEKVLAFKSHGIKVTLGLGGWNDSAGDKYSRLVNNPSAIRTFVIHAIDFIEQFGFDGLDLDWEYPKCWQVECEKGPSSDKQGFASLVRELRKAFSPRGLILSAAVSASKRVIDAGYDVPSLSKNLDWIAVMTYDYHGQWDKKTGHVAPMYAKAEDDDTTFNANFSMHYWMDKGAAAKKLVMGVPMYGQSFSLIEGAANGFGAPTYAGGEPGDETRARGFLAFYEICERIRIQGWKVNRDPGGRVGPYATLNDQWVAFDDDFMVRHKAEYIRSMGFGGGMVWSMDLDDFTGRYCGCGKSPLLANLNHVLRGHSAPSPCPLYEMQTSESPTTTAVVRPVDAISEQTEDSQLSKPQIETGTAENGASLNGQKCSGVNFKADTEDCSKYYLCNNGRYVQLTCPSPLHWNKNHCDWPAKANCRGKAQLRLTAEGLQEIHEDDKPIVACYFTNWAYYRKDIGRFGPEQIDSTLCTHIIYAWAHVDPKSYKLIPGNPELDIDNDFFGKITELKLKGIKAIIGIGGLEDSEDKKWSEMAAEEDNRKSFIASALQFIKRWNFDGLQIAWQYPVCKQEPCSADTNMDRENFSSLLLELAKATKPLDLELSAMVAASPAIASMAYDNIVLSATVDWLSIAANDYYASAAGKASFLMELANDDSYGFSTVMTYWTSVVPARQLVFGVPAFARSYTLRNPSVSAPGSPVKGPGMPGPYTAVPGFLAYYEICRLVQEKEWTATSTKAGTFAVSKSQWASYLSPMEVNQAAFSIKAIGGRGAAFWALDLDDWRGDCKCQSYPLLRALRNGLDNLSVPIECSS